MNVEHNSPTHRLPKQRRTHKLASKTFATSALATMTLLAACASPATPTSAPASPGSAAPAAGAPKRGGKATMVIWQWPVLLNPLLGTQTVQVDIGYLIFDGLTRVKPDATREPALAKEVPTVQNGGITADGKTVTYNLKDNLKFADGSPLNCEDVKYTWKAYMTPGVGVVTTTGYEDIEDVDCSNPQKVVLKFKKPFAPHLTLFGSILPRSAGDPKDMKNWKLNQMAYGAGPFKVTEFKTDEYITLVRNENYYEAGKPYLDGVTVVFKPSSEVALQSLVSGESDIMWNNTEADLPKLEGKPGVKISSPEGIGGERFFFNLAENKDGSDPSKPHAILGDVKVRQAIALGINKQRIIDTLLFKKGRPGTSELNSGFFACTQIQPVPYDAAKAKALLDEAGWKPGADGIREKNGTKLRLKFSTTSGNKLREDSQILILEDMKNIGVEFFVENQPSAVILGTWDSPSPRRRGNFDILMYTTSAGADDPHSQMVNLWSSSRIPSEKNKGGTNYTRFQDPKADDLLSKAATEFDPAKRKDMYCQLAQMRADLVDMVYLYQRYDLESYRDRLQGWEENGPASFAASARNWWIK